MYERILIPTDGSEGATVAAGQAVELAYRFEAALHAIYVIDTETGMDTDIEGVFEAFEEAGRKAVDSVIDLADNAGVESVVAEVAQGRPPEVILAYADEHDIDMIVMGTHGRTGIDRLLLGSVTEEVVRKSPVPVLTVSMPSE